MRRAALALGVAFACSLPGTASAHLVSTRFGELYSGILHPLTALIHVVPWLGLGLLGGLQPLQTVRWSPWALPLATAVGVTLGGLLPHPVWIDHLNVLSFLALGLLLALAVRLGATAFVGISALAGLSHGFANGEALPGSAQWLYVTGVVLAAYALVTLLTGVAQFTARRAAWGEIALRAAGSWIVAIGLVYGGFSLTGSP